MLGGIIVINLLRRPDRLKTVTKSLSKSDLASCPLFIMEAVDGNNMPDIHNFISELAKQELSYLQTHKRRLHHAQVNGKGAVGCYLSHMSAWKFIVKQATANNNMDEPYLILEDDITFPKKCMAEMVDKYQLARSRMDERIPLLLMFELTCIYNCQMYDYFLVPGVFWGTRAYAMNGRDATRILALPWLPIDAQIDTVIRRFRDDALLSVLGFPLLTVYKTSTDIQLDNDLEPPDLPLDRYE
jgi:GR25 family glycosyltransferase involved in LPS biosynthesis